jgi:conjugative relaxase-like TrwC/TraI family protein
MSVPDGYRRLEGSERRLGPNARRVGHQRAHHTVQASIRLSAGSGAAERERVVAYVRRHSLRVEASDSVSEVFVTGTVAQVNAAFAVELAVYEWHGRPYRGCEGPLHIPEARVGIIVEVFGLCEGGHGTGGPWGSPPDGPAPAGSPASSGRLPRTSITMDWTVPNPGPSGPVTPSNYSLVSSFDIDWLTTPGFATMLDNFAAIPGGITTVRVMKALSSGTAEIGSFLTGTAPAADEVWAYSAAGPVGAPSFGATIEALKELHDRGLTPFVVLGFFPAGVYSGLPALPTSPGTPAYGPTYGPTPAYLSTNPNPWPTIMANWQTLITAFFAALYSNFGDAIASWWFEVWNEPDGGQFWYPDTIEDPVDNNPLYYYCQLYEQTILGLNAAQLPVDVTVGGPAIMANSPFGFPDPVAGLLDPFLQFVSGNELQCDFVSIHAKGDWLGGAPPFLADSTPPTEFGGGVVNTAEYALKSFMLDPKYNGYFAGKPIVNDEADMRVGDQVPFYPRNTSAFPTWLTALMIANDSLTSEYAAQGGSAFIAGSDNAHLELVGWNIPNLHDLDDGTLSGEDAFGQQRSLMTAASSWTPDSGDPPSVPPTDLVKLPVCNFYEVVRQLGDRHGVFIHGQQNFFPTDPKSNLFSMITIGTDGGELTHVCWVFCVYPTAENALQGVSDQSYNLQVLDLPATWTSVDWVQFQIGPATKDAGEHDGFTTIQTAAAAHGEAVPSPGTGNGDYYLPTSPTSVDFTYVDAANVRATQELGLVRYQRAVAVENGTWSSPGGDRLRVLRDDRNLDHTAPFALGAGHPKRAVHAHRGYRSTLRWERHPAVVLRGHERQLPVLRDPVRRHRDHPDAGTDERQRRRLELCVAGDDVGGHEQSPDREHVQLHNHRGQRVRRVKRSGCRVHDVKSRAGDPATHASLPRAPRFRPRSGVAVGASSRASASETEPVLVPTSYKLIASTSLTTPHPSAHCIWRGLRIGAASPAPWCTWWCPLPIEGRLEFAGLSQSRRPDSNRGPLHYERLQTVVRADTSSNGRTVMTSKCGSSCPTRSIADERREAGWRVRFVSASAYRGRSSLAGAEASARVLTIGKLGASGAQLDYYERQVAAGAEEYYTGRGEVPGVWLGDGAAGIGLPPGQPVSRAQFMALMGGHHPDDGSLLRRIGGSSKVAAIDLTFSAPKSVSVLFAVCGSAIADRLGEAHDRAVAAALGYLEREACVTRRGQAGVERLTGEGFVAVGYRHRLSRAGDPQLHTHVLVANLTRAEGRFTALDAHALYEHKSAAGAVYRAALRAEVRRHLAWVSWARAGRGLFEIDGIPAGVLRHFSQRRVEIEQRATELAGSSNGIAALDRARMQGIALATRRPKETAVDGAGWREDARARSAEHGFGRPQLRALVARRPAEPARPILQAVVKRLSGAEGLTGSHNTFARRHALAEIAGEFADGIVLADLERATDRYLADSSVVPLDSDAGRFTTADLLTCERAILDGVSRRRHGQYAVLPLDIVDAALARARPALNADQAATVRSIATGGHGIDTVQALAGTGKTTTMRVLADAYRDAGYNVVGAAPTARAARELRDVACIPSATLHAILGRLDRGARFPDKTVVLLDEAGMASTRITARILAHAGRSGAKVIAVGDSGQLPAVQAGGWLATVTRESAGPQLRQVIRQRDPRERRALDALHSGNPEAYLHHKSADITIHAKQVDAIDAVIDDWSRQRTETGASGARSGRLVMIARDNSTRRQLNETARARLTLDGHLTTASLRIGDQDWAPGDRVIARRNDRRLDIDNGTIGTISALLPDGRGIMIRTDSGQDRALDQAYVTAHLEHAYAITGHSSQGTTVDSAIVVGRPEEFTREWSYTALSRARESSTIHIIANLEPDNNDRGDCAPVEAEREPADALHALSRAMRRSETEELAAEHPEALRRSTEPLTVGTPQPWASKARPRAPEWASHERAVVYQSQPSAHRDGFER